METKSIKAKSGMLIDIPDFLLKEITKADTDFLMIVPESSCVQCNAQVRTFNKKGWTYTKFVVSAKPEGEPDPEADALRSFVMDLNKGSRQMPFVIGLRDDDLSNYWGGFNPEPKLSLHEQIQSLAS